MMDHRTQINVTLTAADWLVFVGWVLAQGEDRPAIVNRILGQLGELSSEPR